MDSLTIPGPHGTIPIRIYRAEAVAWAPGLVWAHGGGFAWGDLDMPEAHWVAQELAERGISGLIVPDLPLEEAPGVAAACEAAGIALVPLVAPTTP